MPFVDVRGGRMFYAERQQGGSQDLLFIHCAGGDHSQWAHQMAHIRRADSYALDLPGHGESPAPLRPAIADYAEDAAGFVEAIGLNQPVVCGHSMGGAISLVLALEFPQHVGGLILIGTGARLSGSRRGNELKIDLQTAVNNMAARGLSEWLLSRPEVLAGDLQVCSGHDVSDRLNEITCPTLVVCGVEDQLTPVSYSTYLCDHIAGARLVLVQDGGHMVMVDRAEAVTDAIDAFLAQPLHPKSRRKSSV